MCAPWPIGRRVECGAPLLGSLHVLRFRVLGDDRGVHFVNHGRMVVLVLCGKRVSLAFATLLVIFFFFFFVVGSVGGDQGVTRVCFMDYLVPS